MEKEQKLNLMIKVRKDVVSLFPETHGTRQIFDITIESAQTSCGMSIPFMEIQRRKKRLK